jgi:anti-sigma factor RsiW
MSCPETGDRLHAYLDDELDAALRANFEDHLRGCPECTRELKSQRGLRAGLREGRLRFAAPASLKEQIRAVLRPVAPPRLPIPTWLTAAAALLVGVAAGAAGMYVALARGAPPPGADLPKELAAAHVRSLMEKHLYDVESTDRHTVKPWFQGRVDFTPPVKAFKDDGYPLKGGRLDFVNGRPAAALVYTHNQHVINLFVYPAPGGDAAPQALTQRGYNLLRWTQDGLDFWAVSDLNAGDLGEFARLQRGPITGDR